MLDSNVARGSYAAVVTVVMASTFLAMLAYTGPLGNAVVLTAAFRASPSEVTWILASMSVGLAVSMLSAGVVADRIGRRFVFEIGAALFTLANLVCALAPNALVFIAARVIAGIGATGMIATGLGLIVALGAHAATQQMKTAMWWSVAMGGAVALGPVVSGLLDLVDAWRMFYGLLGLGGIVVWFGARYFVARDRPSKHALPRTFDAAGFVLLTVLLAVSITVIVEVRTGVTPATVVLTCASVALLIAFVLSQRFGRARLIAPEILTHKPFIAATVAGFGTGAGLISVMSYSPSYLLNTYDINTLQAGLLITIWAGMSVVAALGFARLTQRISGSTHLIIGLTGVAAGIALMSVQGTSGGFVRFIIGLFICGAATGLLNGGLARQAVASVPDVHAATGTAANNTARYIGASIGVSAASIISAALGSADGWEYIAWSGVAISLAAATLVLMLSRNATPDARQAAGKPAR